MWNNTKFIVEWFLESPTQLVQKFISLLLVLGSVMVILNLLAGSIDVRFHMVEYKDMLPTF